MAIPTSFADLSTTPASNSPAGSDSVFPDLDGFLRFVNAALASVSANTATNGWVSPYLATAGGTMAGATVLNGALSGTGLTNYLASPAAVGTTAPAGGRFTFAHTAPVAVTFSATLMAVNCALSNVFTIVMTANVTTAMTFSNQKDGQTINIRIKQNGTGGWTMAWPADTIIKWPNNVEPTLSTAASAIDLLTLTYFADDAVWLGSLSKAFA